MSVYVSSLQAVKFEPYHDSSLVRFLLKRALRVSRVNVCFSHCHAIFELYNVCMCVCWGGCQLSLTIHLI